MAIELVGVLFRPSMQMRRPPMRRPPPPAVRFRVARMAPIAARIVAARPQIAAVLRAASRPGTPNHNAAVRAIRAIAVRARVSPPAARALAQMRVVNNVRAVKAANQGARIDLAVRRARQKIAARALAAPPAQRPAAQRAAAEALRRVALMEARMNARVAPVAPLAEVAPQPGVPVAPAPGPTAPASAAPIDEGPMDGPDDGDEEYVDEPSEDEPVDGEMESSDEYADEPVDGDGAEAAGWAWNRPYRSAGGMQRLRDLYNAGMNAR